MLGNSQGCPEMSCGALEVFKAWLIKALSKLAWSLGGPCPEKKAGLEASGPSSLDCAVIPTWRVDPMRRSQDILLDSSVFNALKGCTTPLCIHVLCDSFSSLLEFCRSSGAGLDLSRAVTWDNATLRTSSREGGSSSIVPWLRLRSVDALQLTLREREYFPLHDFCHSQRNRKALTRRLNTRH